MAHLEGSHLGIAWLEIHPHYRHIENEMMDWAEKHLAASNKEGRQVCVEVRDFDTTRQQMLMQRGYEKTEEYGYLRWRPIDIPIPTAPPPEGYKVRSLRPGDRSDVARWADVIRAVFPHAEPTPKIIRRFQTSPSYRHNLHIVAESEDGVFAAFAGLTIDTMNEIAEFEPIGTHPDHLRKGLAKAVMCEGMQRLTRLGVNIVYVGTGDMIPANKLYESVGFTNYHKNYTWRKMF